MPGKTERRRRMAALRNERFEQSVERTRRLDEERRLHNAIKAALHEEHRRLLAEERQRHEAAMRRLR